MSIGNNRSSSSRRRVQFAEEHNTTLVLPADHASEKQWVSQEEFHQVKKSMKRKLGEWKLKGYGVLLRDAFGGGDNNSNNSHNPHIMIKHSATIQKSINAFVQLDERDCVRGMERSVSVQLDQKIAQMKDRSVKTVLSHQRLLRKKKDEAVSLDERIEELAVVSRMQSRACVQFARRLGKADELVVRRINESDSNNDAHQQAVADAHRLVEEMNRMQERQRPKPRMAGPASAVAAAAGTTASIRGSPLPGRLSFSKKANASAHRNGVRSARMA